MNIFKYILDLIYPEQKHCLYCNNILIGEEIEGICFKCLQKIEFIEQYCNICGRNLKYSGCNNDFSGVLVCQECKNTEYYFDKARSISLYSGIMRDIIINFKYEGIREYADTLGKLLYYYYIKYFQENDIDYLLPIPLHENRLKKRKYNQAELITRILALNIKIPVLDNYMLRVRDNPPLYTLDLKKRKEIMYNIFVLDNYINVTGKSILIIDDIFTSGSTVNQAGKILKEKGMVDKVYVLTLATGQTDF
ncbi:MAG: ComF family protein [Bacillota bacterium]